jgi:hypothetical protein
VSPSDVEIGIATRAGNSGTLTFSANVLNSNFGVANTVVNNLKVATAPPGGEGSTAGEEVEITITFTSPIILPAGHYFFRPEVLLTSGDCWRSRMSNKEIPAHKSKPIGVCCTANRTYPPVLFALLRAFARNHFWCQKDFRRLILYSQCVSRLFRLQV